MYNCLNYKKSNCGHITETCRVNNVEKIPLDCNYFLLRLYKWLGNYYFLRSQYLHCNVE